MFVDGVLWIVRTGAPSAACQKRSATGTARYRRFSQKGVWWPSFEAMAADLGVACLIVDSTIVRAHHLAAGARKGGLMILPRSIRLLADPAAA
jgi:transposase